MQHKRGYKRATRYGARNFCSPIDPQTGNPLASCIPFPAWCKKYSYSSDQLRAMLVHKRMRAVRMGGRLYIEDSAPTED